MFFKISKRKNPQNRALPEKFYGVAVNTGVVTLERVARDIERASALSKGDILNVLSSFTDQIPSYLTDNKSVQLGDFGTLRLTISSEGADTYEEYQTKLIRRTKVIFTPGKLVKIHTRSIDISFIHAPQYEKPAQPGDGGGGGDGPLG